MYRNGLQILASFSRLVVSPSRKRVETSPKGGLKIMMVSSTYIMEASNIGYPFVTFQKGNLYYTPVI